MTPRCPRCTPYPVESNPNQIHVIRKSAFFRSSDSRTINRFFCKICSRYFSRATLSICFGQKKRRANEPIYKLLVSGTSQRRIARLLNLHQTTVARKFKFLAEQARLRHREFLSTLSSLEDLQFDEMESSEHTKCKPLSIPLVVTHPGRKILAFSVCSMPANGLLAKISVKKYGRRPDHRIETMRKVLESVKPYVGPGLQLHSDEKTVYPKLVREIFPGAEHCTYKGKRGCVVGQGELKKIQFDPLFSLNHTAAMFRANINRLFRKTWCTTKKAERLLDHIAIYADYHNRILTGPV
mgnify:FL=1